MENSLTVPDASNPLVVAATTSAAELIAQANDLVVDSAPMYEVAGLALKQIREREKALEEARETIVKPMNAALTAVRNLFKSPAEVFASAKKILSDKMVAYDTQERVAREAQERAAATLAREARAKAEAEMVKIEEELKTGAINDEQFLAAAGAASLAAIDVPMPVAAAPLQKMGNASRTDYTFEVTSLPQLLRYLADSLERGEKTFDSTITLKVGQLNAFGKATQGSVVIPGLKWVESKKIIARAG
jgi:hypothetical protein